MSKLLWILWNKYIWACTIADTTCLHIWYHSVTHVCDIQISVHFLLYFFTSSVLTHQLCIIWHMTIKICLFTESTTSSFTLFSLVSKWWNGDKHVIFQWNNRSDAYIPQRMFNKRQTGEVTTERFRPNQSTSLQFRWTGGCKIETQMQRQ